MDESEAKKETKGVPLTVRISDTAHAQLKALAAEQDRTVSHFVSRAIDTFLEQRSGEVEVAVSTTLQFCIEATDLDQIKPVLVAANKPMPIDLFVKLVKFSRKSQTDK